MKFFLGIVFISISVMSYSQHKYVIKVKGGSDTALNLQRVTDNGNSTTNKIKVANLNLSNVPTYTNQDSAIKHGLVNGDVFKLPVQGNRSVLAIVDTLFPEGFTYTVRNTVVGSRHGFQIANSDSVHFTITIDWGDGNTNEYKSYAGYICSHIYSSINVFTVKILINDISIPTLLAINNDFRETGNLITSITGVSKLANLKKLYVEWNQLPAALIDTIKLPVGLTDLGLGGNNLGSFNPVNLPSTLVYLDLRYNNLISLPLNNFPSHLRFCNFNNNEFSSSEVNNMLVHFDNSGVINGQLFLAGETPAAPPSGDGLSAKNSLTLKNWAVTTD